MRDYELMYILRTDLGGEEELNAQIERVNGYVKDLGGSVETVDHSSPWGRRRLGYEIAHQQDGYYVLTSFKMNPKHCTSLEHSLHIFEPVLRYMLVRSGE